MNRTDIKLDEQNGYYDDVAAENKEVTAYEQS